MTFFENKFKVKLNKSNPLPEGLLSNAMLRVRLLVF